MDYVHDEAPSDQHEGKSQSVSWLFYFSCHEVSCGWNAKVKAFPRFIFHVMNQIIASCGWNLCCLHHVWCDHHFSGWTSRSRSVWSAIDDVEEEKNVQIKRVWGGDRGCVNMCQKTVFPQETYFVTTYVVYTSFGTLGNIYIYIGIYIYIWIYGFLNIRTGILDYLRESFPWPAQPFQHTESNSFKHTVSTFKYTNWYFKLPPGPHGLARPPHI